MELRGDRVADPVEDDAVHLAPARIGGRSDVRVDVVEEGVALEDHHHQVTPAGVGGGGRVEDDVHEGADVEDGRCLEVKTGDDSLLIGRRGRRRVGRACGRARHKLAGDDSRLPKAAAAYSSSRRVRAARTRRRAATAFSSASSTSLTRASSLALRAAVTSPGAVLMLAQKETLETAWRRTG
jgi:hypothetical protein